MHCILVDVQSAKGKDNPSIGNGDTDVAFISEVEVKVRLGS